MMPSKNHIARVLIVLLLIVICATVSFYKINNCVKLPYFDPEDGEGFYWSECAFHFRHAKMVAEGKAIQSPDIRIQYPEGLDVERYITPLMDWVSGNLYRLFFQRIPLHVFLVYFFALFSTLSVLAVFFTGRLLWHSNWAGLISACLYAFSPASFCRSSAASLIREDFALPFIFFSFVCFIYCLQKDNVLIAVIGSLLLAVALTAWHATQFYVSLFVTGLVISFFLQKRDEDLPRRSITVLTITIAVAAVILPVLKAKWFVFSPQMMISYGLLISLWLLRYQGISDRKKKLIWAALLISCCLTAGLVIQKYMGSHSHVYSLLVSKLQHFGKLPQDGTALSFETKIMWSSSFVTPTLNEVLTLLSGSMLGIVLLSRSIFRILKGKARNAEIFMSYFVISTLAIFLLVHRLVAFAVFSVALPIGRLATIKDRMLKTFSCAIIAMCLIYQITVLFKYKLVTFRPPNSDVKDVIHFIKTNTENDEAVLTTFQFGPAIAAYTDRPIILHSSFESKAIRDKVKHVYTSLYRSEEDFYQVCKKYHAKLFVYQRNMALSYRPGSIRYIVDALTLDKKSAAAMFHYEPEKLEHFHLVHQNQVYRIFRVGKNTSKSSAE